MAVGDQVRDFQVGEIVVVPPVTPDWRTVPSQLGAHQHCAGLITGQKLSNGEDGLLAEYVRIRDPVSYTHLDVYKRQPERRCFYVPLYRLHRPDHLPAL